MRREHPREKDRRRVPIPADLRDALREVHELIRDARHDPDIPLGYDDAIQAAGLVGGKFGKKARPFVLTYLPAGDAERGRWFLTLHRLDIEDIADGRLNEITLFCCTDPGCRTKFREAGDLCFYCDYVEE